MAKEQTSSNSQKTTEIAAAKGKLGVMIPGMGAVATTFIAGVEAIRKGIAKPIGSLTQMGTIRLGKRTDGRSPKINEFVPLASLNDLVFTGWDIFEDNMYEAAGRRACSSGPAQPDQAVPERSIKPRKAVFDQELREALDGPNVKKGKNKMDLAEQVREDIRDFKKSQGARSRGDDLVRLDRDVHPARSRRPPVGANRSRRACMRTTSSSRLR
jgi:myo-inositol-1-phosphate synthase